MHSISLYIIDSLKAIPWWVYVVFFIGMKRCLAARFDNDLHIARSAILPSIFLIFTLATLFTLNNTASYLTPLSLIGLLIGALIGYQLATRLPSAPSSKRFHIVVRGSLQPLASFLLVFSLKFVEGTLLSLHHVQQPYSITEQTFIIASSIATGLFIGRFVCYCLFYYKNSQRHYAKS